MYKLKKKDVQFTAARLRSFLSKMIESVKNKNKYIVFVFYCGLLRQYREFHRIIDHQPINYLQVIRWSFKFISTTENFYPRKEKEEKLESLCKFRIQDRPFLFEFTQNMLHMKFSLRYLKNSFSYEISVKYDNEYSEAHLPEKIRFDEENFDNEIERKLTFADKIDSASYQMSTSEYIISIEYRKPKSLYDGITKKFVFKEVLKTKPIQIQLI